MKKCLIVFVAMILLQNTCFAQSDSIKTDSLKSIKSYKNNLKIGLLFLAPSTSPELELSYQRAITKKSSLGLNLIYEWYSGNSQGANSYWITPSYSYYLSKFKKNKYNRGVYMKIAAPLNYYSGAHYNGKALMGAIAVGTGYQFIVGKRLAIDLSALGGIRYIDVEKYSPQYGDNKWHDRRLTRLYFRPQVLVGFTF